jgi:ankyrin repeat protein
MVKLLLGKGARKDEENKAGETPLTIAEQEGKRDIIELLR